MKKVIVKCRVKDPEKLEKRLEDLDLEFSPIYWLHDRIYVPRGYKGRSNFPRLIMRTVMHAVDEPPEYRLNLRRHIEDSGIDIYEESPVTDYSAMANIILQLGFKQYSEISRRRQELRLSENTVLYLDTLDTNDFTYAKLEASLKDDTPAVVMRTELISTFRSFGETEIVESSYFEL